MIIILTKEIHVIGNPETFWLVLNWFHSDVYKAKIKKVSTKENALKMRSDL